MLFHQVLFLPFISVLSSRTDRTAKEAMFVMLHSFVAGRTTGTFSTLAKMAFSCTLQGCLRISAAVERRLLPSDVKSALSFVAEMLRAQAV